MIEDKDSYIENIKSKRAAELLMLNHIEMVFSEGDNNTETCAEAIRIAEQDARERAIEAYCYNCGENKTDCCPLIVFNNPCGKLTQFLNIYDK